MRSEGPITRAEAMTIFNRILKRKVLTEDIPEEYHEMYPDLKIGHWAFQDVLEASLEHMYALRENGTEIWQEASKQEIR